MAVIVSVRLRGAKSLQDSLTRLDRFLAAEPRRIARQVGQEALRTVKQLTPRQRRRVRAPFSKRGFPPLYTQWELIEKGLIGTQYQVTIHNRAASTPQGLAILASLEAGARPHVITGNPILAWEQPQAVSLFQRRVSPLSGGGPDVADELRRTRRSPGVQFRGRRSPPIPGRVQHPGHEAFRMVQETRHQMDVLVAAFVKRMQAQIGRIMTVTVK